MHTLVYDMDLAKPKYGSFLSPMFYNAFSEWEIVPKKTGVCILFAAAGIVLKTIALV